MKTKEKGVKGETTSKQSTLECKNIFVVWYPMVICCLELQIFAFSNTPFNEIN